MNAPYDFEDLADYLEGRMSDSDRKAFELALQSDTALAARLEALQSEAKVNRLLREEYLLEQFAEWEKEEQVARRAATGIMQIWVSNRNWIIPAGVAASLIGILCVGLIFHWFDGPNPQPAWTGAQPDLNRDTPVMPAPPARPGDFQVNATDSPAVPGAKQPDRMAQNAAFYAALADSAFIEEDFSEALMGAENPGNAGRYAKAVQLYAAGQYRQALKLLEDPEQNQLEEFLYLRGYTLYHLKQYDKAEADFRAFRNIPVSDRKLDAQWCEVFCMLKQLPASRNRLDRLLTELQSSPGPYSGRAAALQKALERH